MVTYATQAFNSALKESHTVVSKMEAIQGTSTLLLDMLDATTTQDYDDTSRRSLDVNFLIPDSYTSEDLQNLLTERLTKLRPYRGIQYADGTQEFSKIGTFYVTEAKLSESAGVPVLAVKAFDRSVRCQGSSAFPYYIPPNSYASDVVPTLLSRKSPGINFQLAKSQFLTPSLLLTEDTDPWAEAQRLMVSNGQDLFFDRDDICVSASRNLIPTQEYAWHFDESHQSDFINPERNATNDLFPNVINVVGTNSTAPGIAGQAADMDPNSKTYRDGPYGEQVRTFRSEQIITTDQANEMARYLLSALLGPQDQITFNCIPNPTLDPGDTVAMTHVRMGLNLTRMIISHIDLPLTATGLMSVTCRRSILTDTSGTPIRQ